jgi:5-methylcytosine-specific restriction protein A
MCAGKGLLVIATVTDHIIPHRGDMVRFWDRANWQSLCEPCHNSEKQRLESRGL